MTGLKEVHNDSEVDRTSCPSVIVPACVQSRDEAI